MEITVRNEKIELKKDFLTNAEVNYIVSEALKIFEESGDIEGYDYSPLSMITNFYAMLFELCIKDYNMDNIEDYNKYYNIGTHYELLRVIENADEAYHLMMSLSKDLCGIESVIDKNIRRLLEMVDKKFPDEKSITKIMNKLPKEWQKVTQEYNKIIGKNTEGGDA